ncbi:universal bacterial protein YeaZ [Clostridium sp. CAG:575]|nr:universal bacterial protein YeaZ [Clostridium sp. CAG:575]
MKILCIDTSSKLCGVGIFENEKLIDKIELNNGLTHSETLMPILKQILEKNSLVLKDFDLIAVDIGPGSFTGIRIGVATAKAFSDSLTIPCVGIDSLEILAYQIKEPSIVCSAIDCKNDNCYFALYELRNNEYIILEAPSAKTKQEVTDLLDSKYSNKEIKFVGDAFSSKSLFNHLSVENLNLAALKKFTRNNFHGEEILPLYLKKSQAERQLEEKGNA